jgi:hypothetical protein
MPSFDRDLAGDQCGTTTVTLFDDLQQIASLLRAERFSLPITCLRALRASASISFEREGMQRPATATHAFSRDISGRCLVRIGQKLQPLENPVVGERHSAQRPDAALLFLQSDTMTKILSVRELNRESLRALSHAASP